MQQPPKPDFRIAIIISPAYESQCLCQKREKKNHPGHKGRVRDGSKYLLFSDLCGVLVFVRAVHFAEVSRRLSPYGILTLSKSLSKEIVLQSLLLLSATHERLARAEDEKEALSAKIEELRLINRAKCVLIDQLRMSESDAHHYIEKQAMDRCISRRAMAEKILSAYR